LHLQKTPGQFPQRTLRGPQFLFGQLALGNFFFKPDFGFSQSVVRLLFLLQHSNTQKLVLYYQALTEAASPIVALVVPFRPGQPSLEKARPVLACGVIIRRAFQMNGCARSTR